MGFEQYLKLEEGCSLNRTGSRAKGTLGQTDVDSYDVLDAQGQKVGTVEYYDTSEIKAPHARSFRVVQRDSAGTTLVDFHW